MLSIIKYLIIIINKIKYYNKIIIYEAKKNESLKL